MQFRGSRFVLGRGGGGEGLAIPPPQRMQRRLRISDPEQYVYEQFRCSERRSGCAQSSRDGTFTGQKCAIAPVRAAQAAISPAVQQEPGKLAASLLGACRQKKNRSASFDTVRFLQLWWM